MHLDDLYRALDDVAVDSFNAAINGSAYDRHVLVYAAARKYVAAYEHEHPRPHDNWGACRGHCSGTVHHSGHATADDCDRWDNRANCPPGTTG